MLPSSEQIKQWSDIHLLTTARVIDSNGLFAFPEEQIKDENGYSEADYYLLNVYSEIEQRKLTIS